MTSNFIVYYLKAHTAIRVPIYTIEYVMCILWRADCKTKTETKRFSNKFCARNDIDA